MVPGMAPLERVRQFDAKRVSENGNDDPVEKQQNRSDNADAHDHADDQSERNTNDCKGILVGHRATMPPFARGRQGRSYFPRPACGERVASIEQGEMRDG
jgi:hypothetical protein